MNFILNTVELGNRITTLRKLKGYSQEELSQLINISRPSLTQIELGKRNITAIELSILSQKLDVSLDNLLAEKFKAVENITDEDSEKVLEMRISVPKLNILKFKNILLYILEKCAGKPNVGETVINKLLYFSDFNYYEIYEEQMTGAKYIKLQHGPVPKKISSILDKLINDDQIKRIKTKYYDKMQTRFLPLVKADLTQLKASEKEVIDKVIEQMSDWTATDISKYSHNDLPWEVTENGKEINYELVFYREAPYSVRNYDC
jgi:transcriptional regulator with XRE-family HTH domain